MRRKLVIALVLVIGLITAITFVSKTIFKPADLSVSDQFVHLALANKPSETYKLFTASAMQQTSSGEWAESVLQLHIFFQGEKPHYISKTIVDGREVMTYSIQGTKGSYEFLVTLEKEGSSGYKVWSFVSNPVYNTSDTSSTKK
jgi:hypothetical protein